MAFIAILGGTPASPQKDDGRIAINNNIIEDGISAVAKLTDPLDKSQAVKSQARSESMPPSQFTGADQTNLTDRDYYQQLYDARGFSQNFPAYVCFSDDAHSGRFFTFRAIAYDENYFNAAIKAQTIDPKSENPELERQLNIMRKIQETAPYITFFVGDLRKFFLPEDVQFLKEGGRTLDQTLYEKGVRMNILQYRWNGSSWSVLIPPADPNAYVQKSTVFQLSIEPATMRYVETEILTIKVGTGNTAANETHNLGSEGGVCERVPNLK
jgi:hypothetical protein